MLTEWGETLDREHPLPEYPRPQLCHHEKHAEAAAGRRHDHRALLAGE